MPSRSSLKEVLGRITARPSPLTLFQYNYSLYSSLADIPVTLPVSRVLNLNLVAQGCAYAMQYGQLLQCSRYCISAAINSRVLVRLMKN